MPDSDNENNNSENKTSKHTFLEESPCDRQKRKYIKDEDLLRRFT